MQFDRNDLSKLLAMDEESLKALARTIAAAAGADPQKTEALISDPQRLKKRISRISDKEAQQLISAAGEEKSQMILEMLRQRGADIGK